MRRPRDTNAGRPHPSPPPRVRGLKRLDLRFKTAIPPMGPRTYAPQTTRGPSASQVGGHRTTSGASQLRKGYPTRTPRGTFSVHPDHRQHGSRLVGTHRHPRTVPTAALTVAGLYIKPPMVLPTHAGDLIQQGREGRETFAQPQLAWGC
jgi:hypothetical protein